MRVIRISPDDAKSEVVKQMIQARGLPGSVSEGDTEQRGVSVTDDFDGEVEKI